MNLREIADSSGVFEVRAESVAVNNVGDAVDLLGNLDYLGGRAVIVDSSCFPAAFFDLSSKLAGDILQKCVNYRKVIAIVGDFDTQSSSSLKAFIVECNRGNHIFFRGSRDEALQRLKRLA